MRSAACTSDLITCHPMTDIRSFGHSVSAQRRKEAGPARSGLKFRVRGEQFIPACGAEINSFFVIIPIRVLVGRLCFCFAQDLELSESQNLSPFVITQYHLLSHRNGLDLASDPIGLPVFREAEANRKGAQQQ